MSRCKSCGAEIHWYQTPKGKAMPVDAAPSPDGNLWIDDTGQEPIIRVRGMFVPPDKKAYTSHFATCPDAKDHRKVRDA